MKNLSPHNLKLLDKLLGPLEKTDPLQELIRITKYFNDTLKYEDESILYHFKKLAEAKLALVLPSYFMFFRFEFYKEKYLEQLQDFLEDIPDSKEVDFIEKCINEQNSILEKTVKYFLKIDNNNSINAMQFVGENFLDEYKISSEKKIAFLNERKVLFSTSETIDFIVEYENPYPDYFKSYGYELFNIFLKEDLNNNNKILAKASFLVDELRKDRLMNSDLSLKKIFDFIVEKFDLNLGKSTKLKSDFSRKKYLPLYNLIKSNFLKD